MALSEAERKHFELIRPSYRHRGLYTEAQQIADIGWLICKLDDSDALAVRLQEQLDARSQWVSVEVDDAFVERVENEIGMGHGAWDMEPAQDICRAVLKVAALPDPPSGPQPGDKA